MKVVFYASAKPREKMLAESMRRGIEASGDTFELRATGDYGEDDQGNYRKYAGPTDDTDVAIFFGVKGQSCGLMTDHIALGRHTVFLDKGYTRDKGDGGHTLYTRIAIDCGSPIEYMMDEKWPNDRFKRLGIEFSPLRSITHAGHILYTSSSQKYADFFGLGGSDDVALRLIQKIALLTPRQMIYRPKPSDRRAKPLPGIALSTNAQSMQQALVGCHAVVTYGSTAAMEAVIAGVPAIVLGDAIAAPVAQRAVIYTDDVETPFWPDDDLRQRWMNAVAYQQYTQKEMQSGEAWAYVKNFLPTMHTRRAQWEQRKRDDLAALRETEKQAREVKALARSKSKRSGEPIETTVRRPPPRKGIV